MAWVDNLSGAAALLSWLTSRIASESSRGKLRWLLALMGPVPSDVAEQITLEILDRSSPLREVWMRSHADVQYALCNLLSVNRNDETPSLSLIRAMVHPFKTGLHTLIDEPVVEPELKEALAVLLLGIGGASSLGPALSILAHNDVIRPNAHKRRLALRTLLALIVCGHPTGQAWLCQLAANEIMDADHRRDEEDGSDTGSSGRTTPALSFCAWVRRLYTDKDASCFCLVGQHVHALRRATESIHILEECTKRLCLGAFPIAQVPVATVPPQDMCTYRIQVAQATRSWRSHKQRSAVLYKYGTAGVTTTSDPRHTVSPATHCLTMRPQQEAPLHTIKSTDQRQKKSTLTRSPVDHTSPTRQLGSSLCSDSSGVSPKGLVSFLDRMTEAREGRAYLVLQRKHVAETKAAAEQAKFAEQHAFRFQQKHQARLAANAQWVHNRTELVKQQQTAASKLPDPNESQFQSHIMNSTLAEIIKQAKDELAARPRMVRQKRPVRLSPVPRATPTTEERQQAQTQVRRKKVPPKVPPRKGIPYHWVHTLTEKVVADGLRSASSTPMTNTEKLLVTPRARGPDDEVAPRDEDQPYPPDETSRSSNDSDA